MLLRHATLQEIARGEIQLAFRRWRRPTVRSGGTLLTAVGQLQIGNVCIVSPSSITAEDAARAGYSSREALLTELDRRESGEVFRVELLGLQPDPRIALRQTPLDSGQFEQVRQRLATLDVASDSGAWTLRTLQLLREHPGVRAANLCKILGQERSRFKGNVRKLKAVGLTISLEVGYQLSPRGEAYLDSSGQVRSE